MSEIRNLTRNGETFYPLTIAEAVSDPSGNYIGNYVNNPEWIRVICDSEGKVLAGIKANGEIEWSSGVPTPIKEYIQNILSNYSTTSEIQEALSGKVDKEEGKGLIPTQYIQETENPEFVRVEVDSNNKILEGTKKDGTKVIGGDTQIVGDATVLGSLEIEGAAYTLMQNPEWVRVIVDAQQNILCGIQADGSIYLNSLTEIPSPIKDVINNLSERVNTLDELFSIIDNPEFIDVETDSEGKVLGGRMADGSKLENLPIEFKDKVSIDGNTIENIQDPEERISLLVDKNKNLVSYRKKDGTHVEMVGLETNRLSLTEKGMSDFQKALRDSGFTTGKGGDFSDTITKKGKNPVYIDIPRCAVLNILSDVNLTQLSKSDQPGGIQKVNYDVKCQVEFFDGRGVYFKKTALIGAQGNSSMSFVKKNISLKIFDTENVENSKGKWGKGDTFGIKFGDWVMQKSFHLKAYYTDYLRGAPVVAYQLAEDVVKSRGIYEDRPWKKALLPYIGPTSPATYYTPTNDIKKVDLQIDNGARCMPDGFPVIVYQNGAFYGIFSWQIKKDADNYHLDTSNPINIHLDGELGARNIWGGNINWTAFEVRCPEDLKDINGNDYDGDHPTEIEDGDTKTAIINLSHRVGEINNMAIIPTTNGDISIGTFKGNYDATQNFSKGSWVYGSVDGETYGYFMSIHTTNQGNSLDDTNYWVDITEEIGLIRDAIETYFDVDNIVDYQLTNMVLGDTDAFGKNWQWITYDGVKWYVCQYDKDQSFGMRFHGAYTRIPKEGWINDSQSAPNGLVIKYFVGKFKERWNELVEKKIFSVENLENKINSWASRIGQINYEKEWSNWPESPCNRNPFIDYVHWSFLGEEIAEIPSENVWESVVEYSPGEDVWFPFFEGNRCLKFRCRVQNLNKPCLTDSYASYPNTMGYYDNVYRYIKYVESMLEIQNLFINNLNI